MMNRGPSHLCGWDLRRLERSVDFRAFQPWRDRNRRLVTSPLSNRSTLNRCHSGGTALPDGSW